MWYDLVLETRYLLPHMTNIDPIEIGDLSDLPAPEVAPAVDAMQQRIDDLESQLTEAKENNAKLRDTLQQQHQGEKEIYRTAVALLPWGKAATEVLVKHKLLRVKPEGKNSMGAAKLMQFYEQALADCPDVTFDSLEGN